MLDGFPLAIRPVHDHDGSWEFLDGGDVTRDDIAVVHLHHLLARHPRIREVADLPPGRQAWLDERGVWQRSPALP